jgi:hypothetical protein
MNPEEKEEPLKVPLSIAEVGVISFALGMLAAHDRNPINPELIMSIVKKFSDLREARGQEA